MDSGRVSNPTDVILLWRASVFKTRKLFASYYHSLHEKVGIGLGIGLGYHSIRR